VVGATSSAGLCSTDSSNAWPVRYALKTAQHSTQQASYTHERHSRCCVWSLSFACTIINTQPPSNTFPSMERKLLRKQRPLPAGTFTNDDQKVFKLLLLLLLLFNISFSRIIWIKQFSPRVLFLHLFQNGICRD